MELKSPPFWNLPFRQRKVGASMHAIRGLIVFDPAGQRKLPDGKIRVYVANENALYVLYEVHATKNIGVPKSEGQSWIAVRAYAAFLNPQLARP